MNSNDAVWKKHASFLEGARAHILYTRTLRGTRTRTRTTRQIRNEGFSIEETIGESKQKVVNTNQFRSVSTAYDMQLQCSNFN